MNKDLVSRMNSSTLTCVPYHVCKGVVIRDSLLDTNGEDFVCDENIDAYFVLINTWLNMFNPAEREYFLIRERILDLGLIPVINECSEAADCIVHNVPISYEYLANLPKLGIAQALQLLRYPKRLSPLHCDGLERESLSAFKRVQNEDKLADRKVQSTAMRAILQRSKDILRPLSISENRAKMLAEFSTGATAGHAHTTVSRVCEAVEMFPEHFYGYTCTSHFREKKPYTAKVNSQPKSYKARRLICMEDSGRNYFCAGIRRAILELMDQRVPGHDFSFESRIPIKDQGVNQMLSYVGSLSGEWATLDFSNASDRITGGLARYVLPGTVVDAIDKYRATQLEYPNGDISTCYMWLPSGNTVTFLCESLIFFAVVLSACEVSGIYTGQPSDCFVYGDDTIIPSAHYEFVADVVSNLGWQLNGAKSYFDSGDFIYRESCGHEYLNGVRCDSHYFPRKPISISDDGLAKLVDLQHRLYDVSWRSCEWLTQLLRLRWPKLTSSPRSEEDAVDLWGSLPPVLKRVPYATFVDVNVPEKIGSVTLYKKRRQLRTCEVLPHMLREWHSVPKTLSYGQVEVFGEWTEQELKEQYDLYCYYDFLQNGPRYLDELSRLLKVSEPRVAFNVAARRTTSTYAF